MQFEFTEEQKMIRGMAEEFARVHGASSRVREAVDSESGYEAQTWQALCELGLSGLLVSEHLGGQGLGPVEMALVFEALGGHLVPSPLLGTGVLAASLLSAIECEASVSLQREIASGHRLVAIARFESGEARFVLDAHAAHWLLAEFDGALLAFQAERPGDFPGMELERLTMMDQTRVLSQLKISQDLDTNPLEIAHGDQVTEAFDRALDMGRIAIAAEAVGAAQACLSRTLDYVRERVQFGRKIGSFQAVKHQLADVMVANEAAISAVYFAACAASETPQDLASMAALAKVEASEALSHAAGRMIQLHGGIGFTWEHDAHLYFKRARGTATLFGSNSSLDEVIATSLGLGVAA